MRLVDIYHLFILHTFVDYTFKFCDSESIIIEKFTYNEFLDFFKCNTDIICESFTIYFDTKCICIDI